ncbi:Crp/Fnr family transcriptional regulator [Leptolyngbyaceae cyanobacterium UHCC 1019]
MSQNLLQPENRLLSALPAADYQRLLPHLEAVSLPLRKIIHLPGGSLEHVYFPYQALISLVTILEDGSTVENSLVGREGMVGIQAFLGNEMPHQAIVQVEGDGVRLPIAAFKAEFDQNGALHNLVLSYLRFLMVEMAQGNACNCNHTLEERLARWLLNVSDRLDDKNLPLTQEFIAQMLGTRRAGVTVAAGILQQAGMIRYRRGNITILNRENLEATTCECYRVIKTELNRLLKTYDR